MMFTREYFVGNAATWSDQYCAQHPEDDHTWAAMKDLHCSWVAPTKHCTDAAFQKLCSAKQGLDLTVMLLSAYIVTTCESTNITDYNKRMFF